jgi:hypothetical protein
MRWPRITKAEAMAIAKAKSDTLGWPWTEPVTVKVGGTLPPGECGWRHWTVKTSADAHGPVARTLFDVSFDGRHVLPRWLGRPGPPG